MSGKQISINKNALEVAKKKFELSDGNDSMKPDMFSAGFKTATGKSISIREDSLKLAKEKILEKNEDFDYPAKTHEIKHDFSTGFKTVSGKTIEIKKDAYEDARKKFDLTRENEESSLGLTNGFGGGFKTATGKTISIREDSLKLAKEKILDSIENPKIEINNNFNGGFKTVSGKPIEVNKDALEAAKKKFDPNDSKDDGIQYNKQVQEVPKAPLVNSVPPSMNNRRMLDGKRFKKPQLIHKAKLSKYIEMPTDETSSSPKESVKNDDMCISINNLFDNTENSILQENEVQTKMNDQNSASDPKSAKNNAYPRLNSNSTRLNNYIRNNESIFNPQISNQITFLSANELEFKEISKMSVEPTGHKIYVVKPVLELKTMQVE